MYKIFVGIVSVAILLFVAATFVPAYTWQAVKTKVVGADAIAGQGFDVDGSPVFWTDGSDSAIYLLRLARMPESLESVMRAPEENLFPGQVFQITCSKDMSVIVRAKVVDHRSSARSSSPEAPLSAVVDSDEKLREISRPFDKTFAEGATVDEVLKALPFREITTLAKAN